MDKICHRNPSKSEVIGRCGGDEKTNATQNRQKSNAKNFFLKIKPTHDIRFWFRLTFQRVSPFSGLLFLLGSLRKGIFWSKNNFYLFALMTSMSLETENLSRTERERTLSAIKWRSRKTVSHSSFKLFLLLMYTEDLSVKWIYFVEH